MTRVMVVCVIAVGSLMALAAGCGNSGDTQPAPTPAQPEQPAQPGPGDATKGAPQPLQDLAKGVNNALQKATGANPEKAPEVPFAEKVAKSIPLSPTPADQVLAGKTVKAVRCTVEGHEFIGDSGSTVVGRIELGTDGMLYVIDQEYKIRRFTVGGEGDACTLTLDTAFGQGGALDPGGRVKELAAVAGDRIIASAGVGNSYRITKGQVDLTCSESRQGYVVGTPDGSSFIGHFVSPPLRKIAYTDTACSVEEWSFEMPLKNINQVAFVGGNVLVGGVMSEKVGNREPRIVVAFNTKGRELFRFGSTAEGFSDDHFGWVHAIEPCGKNICVVDSNFRRLSMWKNGGAFLGAVSLSKLFGLDYPWITDMESAPNNTAYFSASQQRQGQGGEKNLRVYEGLIYRAVWGG